MWISKKKKKQGVCMWIQMWLFAIYASANANITFRYLHPRHFLLSAFAQFLSAVIIRYPQRSNWPILNTFKINFD
jgi:hypothetical protein